MGCADCELVSPLQSERCVGKSLPATWIKRSVWRGIVGYRRTDPILVSDDAVCTSNLRFLSISLRIHDHADKTLFSRLLNSPRSPGSAMDDYHVGRY
jgi:hypothetical protein